jgi:hypothetical protein
VVRIFRGHPVHAIRAFGKGFYRLWMRFAYLLGTINRYVLLTVFYWVIVNVTNLVIRIGRGDLLDRRMKPATSYWRAKDTHVGTYRSQF